MRFLLISMCFIGLLLMLMYAGLRNGYEVDLWDLTFVLSAESYVAEFADSRTLKETIKNVVFENPLVYFFEGFVPRVIYSDKSTSEIVNQFTYLYWGYYANSSQGTVLPGILGQYWLWNKWLGVLVMPFHQFIVYHIVRVAFAVNRRVMIVYNSLFVIAFIQSLRFFTLSAYLPLILFALSYKLYINDNSR